MLMFMVRQLSLNRWMPVMPFRTILFIFLLFSHYTALALAITPLEKVSLIPLWSPQAQFAGYYVALDKGIYARHGIDMTILNSPSASEC